MCSFNACICFIHPPVDIPAADNDSYLHAQVGYRLDIMGILGNDVGIKAKAFVAH